VCSLTTSKLLDFDLCDKVGENYPSTYNHMGIGERHLTAMREKPRCISHDQYSILYIIKTNEDIVLSDVQLEIFNRTLNSLINGPLKSLTDFLGDLSGTTQ